jgi:DNA-binding NtrC family response regulator
MLVGETGGRPCSVLLADDEKAILLSLRDALRDAGAEVTAVSTGAQALRLLEERPFDIVVSDVRMPGLSGLQLLKQIRERGWDTPVILMTAFATIEEAVDAIKCGAHDYVTKPFPDEKVVRMVEHAWSLQSLRAEVRDLRARSGLDDQLKFLVGVSEPWMIVLDKVRAAAPTDSTVLITGPSGSGKEMIANAVQILSRRKQGPFIKVHCAALPESLIENELFGHEKGAFTGAAREVKGRFELAHGGTLLLDEVDDMPLTSQVKLLRVIQERVIERLGSARPIPIDVRLIATSKADLEELVRAGRFRQDLYYRLSVVRLWLPPLVERPEDIPLLVEHFLAHCRKHMMRPCLGFTPDALDMLLRYEYPGNVRELQHIVESCCALSSDGPVGPQQLPEAVRRVVASSPESRRGFSGRPLQGALDEFEQSYLADALRTFGGTRAGLAARLGISRKTLWEKLKKYGLIAE